jgi:hypothetical protein
MVMEIANQGKIGNLLINGRPHFPPLSTFVPTFLVYSSISIGAGIRIIGASALSHNMKINGLSGTFSGWV